MAVFTTVRRAEAGEIQVSQKEALRFLGYGGVTPKPAEAALIEDCTQELLSAVQGRSCYMRVPVSFPAPFTVNFGCFTAESVSLQKHLQGCHSAFLLAATLGSDVDRLLTRYGKLAPSRALVMDALASSAIEHWCDLVEREITRETDKHCERFSPGYGDFALEYQSQLTLCLDTGKNLGLFLSKSLLMTPTKSVTAIIGLGASTRTCGNKCLQCGKKDCIYREVLPYFNPQSPHPPTESASGG